MKAAIFSGKGPSMARIGAAGTGFFIHRNLLLTTHANLPSVSAAEAAEIRLHNGVAACLFPHRSAAYARLHSNSSSFFFALIKVTDRALFEFDF